MAALLAALVAVQALDLVPCADEAEAASHADGSHVDGAVAAGAHPTPAPGAEHDGTRPHEDGAGLADCLCHVVWTRTECGPEVASAPVAPPMPYAPYLMHLGSVYAKPLDHIPLG